MSRQKIFAGAIVAGALVVGGTQLASAGPSKVTICHKPGTDSEATLSVAAPAVAAHLGHGDALGACVVPPPTTVPPPPTTVPPTTVPPTTVPPTTVPPTTVPPVTTTVSAPD